MLCRPADAPALLALLDRLHSAQPFGRCLRWHDLWISHSERQLVFDDFFHDLPWSNR